MLGVFFLAHWLVWWGQGSRLAWCRWHCESDLFLSKQFFFSHLDLPIDLVQLLLVDLSAEGPDLAEYFLVTFFGGPLCLFLRFLALLPHKLSHLLQSASTPPLDALTPSMLSCTFSYNSCILSSVLSNQPSRLPLLLGGTPDLRFSLVRVLPFPCLYVFLPFMVEAPPHFFIHALFFSDGREQMGDRLL